MIIRISDSAFTTTLGIGTTIADNHNCLDEYSTTVSCLTSSLSTSPLDDTYIYLNSANNYINSLSNEQIVMLEEKLEAQNSEIITVGDKTLTLAQVEELTTPSLEHSVKKTKTYKKI